MRGKCHYNDLSPLKARNVSGTTAAASSYMFVRFPRWVSKLIAARRCSPPNSSHEGSTHRCLEGAKGRLECQRNTLSGERIERDRGVANRNPAVADRAQDRDGQALYTRVGLLVERQFRTRRPISSVSSSACVHQASGVARADRIMLGSCKG